MLVNTKETAGMHTIIWDGRDTAGKKVSSGVYFLRFEAEVYSATKKLLLIR
jgi:flagellar hook assembly protein FlgD